MEVQDRILMLIDSLGMNKNSFSVSIGIQPQTLHHIVAGRRTKPSFDVIERIISTYSCVNPLWLITGQGEMFVPEKIEFGEKENSSINEDIQVIVTDREGSGTIQIPIVDIAVAAGTGCYNPNNIEVVDSISLPDSMIKPGVQYLCVRVKGESMAPTLLDSSFLVIRMLTRAEWAHLADEQIYVLSDMEGKAYVKRVKNRFKRGFIVCMSDNPDKAYYPNFNLQENEINTIWHAEWYISAKMPNIHQTYYNKVTTLEDDIADIKNELRMIHRQLGAGV